MLVVLLKATSDGVLKASLITLPGIVFFGPCWATCMEHQLIFLNLSALSSRVRYLNLSHFGLVCH